MNAQTTDFSPVRLARASGLLYLIIILCGVGSEAIVRSQIFVAGDWQATAANLVTMELPFRISILADATMALADVALAGLLFFLLAPAGKMLSLSAMTFRLVQAAILGLNLLNLYSAASIATGGSPMTAGMGALMMRFLEAHTAGYDLGLFFFAINSLLVGVLIVRSGFLPRLLGYGIFAAGMVYLGGSTLRVLDASLNAAFAPAYVIPLVAETALCLWLLTKGVDVDAWNQRQAIATSTPVSAKEAQHPLGTPAQALAG